MATPPFLPPNSAVKIHEATLQVLENTGVILDHEEAQALCLKAGGKKDDEGRILIPRRMVNEALEKANPSI
jgi:trimethylamine:corrinoid methyltransferase-like protein